MNLSNGITRKLCITKRFLDARDAPITNPILATVEPPDVVTLQNRRIRKRVIHYT